MKKMHFSKILGLVLLLPFTYLGAVRRANKAKKPQTSALPKILIKQIRNTTPYDLLFVDRLSKSKDITLPAGELTELSISPKGRKIAIMGSMAEIMSKKAQFIIKKLDENGKPEKEQEAYLNISVEPGGVNDGSGFITGKPGSVIAKFYMSGTPKNGGCIMSSRVLKKPCKTVEFDITLYMNEDAIAQNIFRVFGEGVFEEN